MGVLDRQVGTVAFLSVPGAREVLAGRAACDEKGAVPRDQLHGSVLVGEIVDDRVVPRLGIVRGIDTDGFVPCIDAGRHLEATFRETSG
ncbi:hypothetical protein D3C71_250370 [compost metagenome]